MLSAKEQGRLDAHDPKLPNNVISKNPYPISSDEWLIWKLAYTFARLDELLKLRKMHRLIHHGW